MDSQQHLPTQGRRHPLLFPEIVSKICTFLPFEDLKTCRLLNKIWNREASSSLLFDIDYILLCNRRQMKKFTKIFSGNLILPNPFRSFTFRHSNISELFKAWSISYPYHSRWEVEFLQIFGANIHELNFADFSFNRQLSLMNIHQLLSKFCPQLSKLFLHAKDFGSSSSESVEVCGIKDLQRLDLSRLRNFTFFDTNEVSSSKLREFMRFMPNLEVLSYQRTRNKLSHDRAAWKVGFIRIFTELFQSGILNKVTALDCDTIHGPLLNKDVKRLLKLDDLKLESFGAKVTFGSQEEYKDLCTLMEKFEPTLMAIDIRIRFTDSNDYNNGWFPIMTKVVELTLLHNSFTDCFIQCFPNARHIRILHDYQLRNAAPVSIPDSNTLYKPPRHDKARNIVIRGGPTYVHEFLDMGKRFKHMRILDLDAYSDDDLKDVWVELKHVKILRIVIHQKITDRGFVGDGLPELPSIIDNKDISTLHSEENLEKLFSCSCIGKLPNLHTLEINAKSFNNFKFTNALIIFGIVFLKNLRNLTLPPNISPKCLENSVQYLTRLTKLRRLVVCEATFNNVLPLHTLKMEIANLDILVKYRTKQARQDLGLYWKSERLQFPDFLPGNKLVKMKSRK